MIQYRFDCANSPEFRSDLDHQLRYSVLPLINATGDIGPEDDLQYTAAAWVAKNGSRAARNALYFAFLPKIERFARREARLVSYMPGSSVLSKDDIDQESFLVFVGLIAKWPGGLSFSRYFLGHFRWALKNAIRSAIRPARALPLEELSETLGSPQSETEINLDSVDFLSEVSNFDRQILIWKVRDGESLEAIGARLGLSPRSMVRVWGRLRARLRKMLNEETNES